MTINESIRNALSDVGMPSYYVTRGSNKAPCIVYNYTEIPHYFADNEEKASKYTVLLNVYCLENIEVTKKLVIDKMVLNGFLKKSVLSTMLEDTGYFNTPIQFSISLRGNYNE